MKENCNNCGNNAQCTELGMASGYCAAWVEAKPEINIETFNVIESTKNAFSHEDLAGMYQQAIKREQFYKEALKDIARNNSLENSCGGEDWCEKYNTCLQCVTEKAKEALKAKI